ncbi:zinc ribbon domain-containing protein [Candidatus Bathyarchaeota archaeon]|nr:zinc ribbon domain-containing protein [Candidatus Bathyarchaeota archaeon]
MVYCSKCGTKNEEDATHCTKCGVNLEVSREKRFERRAEEWGEQFGKRAEEECFGLPHGGAISGIIFGIIILVFGFAWLTGVDIWANIGPFMAILVGLLIVAGAIYGVTRRR